MWSNVEEENQKLTKKYRLYAAYEDFLFIQLSKTRVETIWIRVENTKTKLRTTIRLERNDGIMLTGL